MEDRCLPSITVSVGDSSANEGVSALKSIDQFVPNGSGGLSRARSSVFGPDGNLYVASADTNAVLRYNGATGAFIDAFVPSGSGGLNSPWDLAFSAPDASFPDGCLYVSSVNSGQVLRYDAVTGAFVGVVASGLSNPGGLTFGSDGSLYIANQLANEILQESSSALDQSQPPPSTVFVSPGSGGLSRARNAVFGPDGNLYVASQATNQVLRYNGQTGAFIDVFATQTNTTAFPYWMEFGPDGYLYATEATPGSPSNQSMVRLNATTGALVDTYALGTGGWSFNLRPGNIVYDSSNATGGFVNRLGPSSLEAFTVSLNSASTAPVTVNYATADGTAVAGRDYTATSGALTIPAGLTSQTILDSTIDDGVTDPTKDFTINLSSPVGAVLGRSQGFGTILDDTKFYVVDGGTSDSTFQYAVTGGALGNNALTSGDTAPRGVATTAAGTTQWVVDANKNVYVYNTGGALLGSWSAGGLSSSATLTGIATNGTDIWLVDSYADKVYKYSGAASRLAGSQTASGSFSLAGGKNGDPNPQDIVTDGTSFWVVDGTKLKVFKYTLSGSLLGSWAIDPADAHPTGITINPNNVSDVWIVDNGTDKVYQYVGAASRTSGSQNAGATFALNPYDTNPQGIADPPPADLLLTPPAAPLAPSLPSVAPVPAPAPGRVSAAARVPSLAGRDAVFAPLGRKSPQRSREPAVAFPAGAGLTAWLDSLTPVAEGAGTPAGLSGGQPPLGTSPPLTPENSQGARTDRSAEGLSEDAVADAESSGPVAVTDSFLDGLADDALATT
jgi:hypothetical protein